MSAGADSPPSRESMLGVLWSDKTYRDLLYILVEFPLGIFYFTFVVTVLSVGLSLVWTFVGFAIIVFALVVCRSLTLFECRMAELLTGHQMPSVPVLATSELGFWPRIWAILKDRESWMSMLYLFLRFPASLIAFCVMVSLVSGSIWAILQPLVIAFGVHSDWGAWHIDTVGEGFLFVLPGLVLLPLSLHVSRALATWLADSTRWIVGRVSAGQMRELVLRALADGRGRSGETLIRELQLFHGYSVDLTATKVYGTLLGLESAGLVAHAEREGVEIYTLR